MHRGPWSRLSWSPRGLPRALDKHAKQIVVPNGLAHAPHRVTIALATPYRKRSVRAGELAQSTRQMNLDLGREDDAPRARDPEACRIEGMDVIHREHRTTTSWHPVATVDAERRKDVGDRPDQPLADRPVDQGYEPTAGTAPGCRDLGGGHAPTVDRASTMATILATVASQWGPARPITAEGVGSPYPPSSCPEVASGSADSPDGAVLARF